MNAPVKFICFVYLMLSMSSVFGGNLTFKKPYEVSNVDENCVILESPKVVKGTQICSYYLQASEVALKSNLFEFVDNAWYLVSPGIPNIAKVRKENDATLLSGETLCQIEDKAGTHTAGAKCYFGMAYVSGRTLTFRSAPIPLSQVKNDSFTGHDIAFIEIVKANFIKSQPHAPTTHLLITPSIAVAAVAATPVAIGYDKDCFENIDAYLITNYGKNYKDDDNIDVKNICYGAQKVYWVADKTSGTNYSRELLIERSKKGVCLALSVPPVASIEAGVLGKNGLPKLFTSIDQAPPGFPSHEVTYLLNLKKYKYQPTLCKEIHYVGDKRSERTMSCKTMLGM